MPTNSQTELSLATPSGRCPICGDIIHAEDKPRRVKDQIGQIVEVLHYSRTGSAKDCICGEMAFTGEPPTWREQALDYCTEWCDLIDLRSDKKLTEQLERFIGALNPRGETQDA